jgi:hypothetical protein
MRLEIKAPGAGKNGDCAGGGEACAGAGCGWMYDKITAPAEPTAEPVDRDNEDNKDSNNSRNRGGGDEGHRICLQGMLWGI